MLKGFRFLRSTASLARANLTQRPTRSLAAVLGLGFAVLLIFIQLGFLGSAGASATLITDRLDFDVLIASSQFEDLNRPGTMSLRRVEQAFSAEGVADAVPLYLGLVRYRNPRTRHSAELAGSRRNMMIMGVVPEQDVFRESELPGIGDAQKLLEQHDAMLFDLASRSQFVKPDGTEDPELGPERMRVVGWFRMGTGFGADGLAVLGDATFCRLTRRPPDTINLGLVRVRPGYSADGVMRALARVLPSDVRLWTREEINERLRTHWVWEMPIGIVFVFGTTVAVVVGVVFGYQVISSDVANRLREFATLKALGYTNAHLSAVVVVQALVLSMAAYALAFGVAVGAYAYLQWMAGIPMGMDVQRTVIVFAVSVAMCATAAWLALGRVKTADPANLF